MTLQDLLGAKGIDLEHTKLIRHNLSNDEISTYYNKGYIELYQSIQRPSRFKNCDYVISFIGEEGTLGTLLGCYKVNGYVEYDPAAFPDDFPPMFPNFDSSANSDPNGAVFFDLEKTTILEDLQNRLVIDWGKGAISWCQNGTTTKEVVEIRRTTSEIEFVDYDNIVLSWENLRKIVYNKASYKKWEDKLSAVAGVYLITDTNTGKHYVGSASGMEGGIWGRWSEYAKTKHGGNKQLVALIANDPDYCCHFQYSILEVLPLKQDKHDVLAREQLFKRKLQSIKFGLNDN